MGKSITDVCLSRTSFSHSLLGRSWHIKSYYFKNLGISFFFVNDPPMGKVSTEARRPSKTQESNLKSHL